MEKYGEKPFMARMIQRMTNPFMKKEGFITIGTTQQYHNDLKKRGFTR